MVSRRRGEVRLGLDSTEREVLVGLFDQLGDALDELESDDPIRRRLFPDGHRQDAAISSEFRELTEAGLLDERKLRLAQCRADVVGNDALPALGPDEARRWLQVLNDLRLAIGTRIGVSEQSTDIDPKDPDAQAWAVYHWLSALQDALVDAVSG